MSRRVNYHRPCLRLQYISDMSSRATSNCSRLHHDILTMLSQPVYRYFRLGLKLVLKMLRQTYNYLLAIIPTPTPSPPYSTFLPPSAILSDFTKITTFYWNSVILSSDYSNLHEACHPLTENLRIFLLDIR